MLSCDTAGRITFVNRVAEVLTGWQDAEAFGRPVADVVRTLNETTNEAMEPLVGRVLRDGESITIENALALVTRDDGRVPIDQSAAPIRDQDGRVAGVVLVLHDATERRRIQQALRQSEARLIEANRAKDDFLATLSHELRTPMNAIVGWAQMLTTGRLDGPTVKRGLEAIVRNAQAQMQLVTDILDVSRIVSGKLRLDIHTLDLIPVLYSAIDAVRPAADAKGITVDARISAGSLLLPADANRLQQVVWNLLSNAVKFTPRGGRVEVSLAGTESQVVVRVSDNGIGISPDLLPRVFDRFVQADSSSKRSYSGLGLGLSIVRHLVELHGGTVEAESPGEGLGASFTVCLPQPAAAAVRCGSGGRSGGSTCPHRTRSPSRWRDCGFSSWTTSPTLATCYRRCFRSRAPWR